jgi:hypothetical protein
MSRESNRFIDMSTPEGLNASLPQVRDMCVPILSSLDQRVTESNWCNCLCFWTPAALFTPKNWICCLLCTPLIPCCCGCYDTNNPVGGSSNGGNSSQNITVNVNTSGTNNNSS